MQSLSKHQWSKRLAKEAFWSPAQKDSDRAITPAVEAVHVPAHLAPPGSLQAKQLCHIHTQLSLGAELPQAKKVLCLCAQGRFGHVRLFATL